MTEQDEIIKALYVAVVDGNSDLAAALAQRCLDAGTPPLAAIEQGLTPGIREIGDRFGRGEIFLPEMMLAADAMEEAINVLEPHLVGEAAKKKGRVIIGTVKGDIHDLGKNIVIALLKVNGYEVIDIGRDVPAGDFIDRAVGMKAQIIGLSGLLTTALPIMREVIEMMEEEGIRNRFKVIIGGGPTSQGYAEEIGADGYGETAQNAVELCDALLGL
jgi:corrinoid protein of di/trimethylamine methyltransferase